jgi:hypothetical protein
MNLENRHWKKRFDFAMLSSWLLMSVFLALISLLWFGQDFRGYFAAAQVIMAGGNPYDYRQVAQVLLEVTGEMGNNPYYYPPWFAWLFILLTYLPFEIARAIWMAFNVIIWDLALWQLGKILDWPKIEWQRYGLFTLTTFCFAWITWRYEQAGILVFAILIAFILSMRKHNSIASGIWLALLLIKPNVTLIVVAGISLWLWRHGQRRTVLVTVLTLLGLFSIATFITPEWYQPLFEDGFGQGLTVALDGPDRVVAVRINTTFVDWLRTLGVTADLRMLIYGCAILIGAVLFLWSVYHFQSLIDLVSVLLLISYALTPYALQYDYPSLAIVLFWALSRAASSPNGLRLGIVLAAFVCSVIFWQQNISWAYWMVVGLIALAAWGQLQKREITQL